MIWLYGTSIEDGNQYEMEEALKIYFDFRKSLGRKPSSREFYQKFPKKKLEKLFLGGKSYTQLQEQAGDVPNKFSSPKSNLEGILLKWGELARITLKTNNKFPVISDWAYHGFKPSVNGFSKSHNLKWSEIPEVFYKKFKDNQDWGDIISKISIDTSEVESVELNNSECYVYLMNDLRNNTYKIGISNDPEYRERTLQSEQPKIKLIAAKKYINRKIAGAIEKALHNLYSHKRKRGEWFYLDKEDVFEISATLND